MSERRCTVCLQIKPTDEFYVRRTGTPYSDCKDCTKSRQRAFAKTNPERRRKIELASHHKHRLRRNARNRLRYHSDPENKEKTRQQTAQWRAKNRERWRELSRMHKKVRGQKGRVRDTPGARLYARILLGDPCSYCGRRAETVDHIVAVSSGGDNNIPNLTGACHACNSSKRSKPLLRFLLTR